MNPDLGDSDGFEILCHVTKRDSFVYGVDRMLEEPRDISLEHLIEATLQV